MNRTARRMLALAFTAFLFGGTSALAHSTAAGLPSVAFEATDYAFTGPAQVTTGLVEFELTNSGEEPHHLQIARLADGVSLDAWIALLQENEGAALSQVELVGGVGVLLPGQSHAVTVELAKPGTYIVTCFVGNEEGVPHLALGMVTAFEVVASDAATADADAARPEVDLTVTLIDYEFDIPDVIEAGVQTWEVVNSGPEIHEMALMRLVPGKTMADVEAFMQNPAGDMPLIFAGGVQALSPDLRNYITLDLEPGDYVALCFVPSPSMEGAPHMALGMVKPFRVVATEARN